MSSLHVSEAQERAFLSTNYADGTLFFLTYQKELMKTIGIIGAGHVGSALAHRLHEAGFQVLLANSRGPDSLAAVAHATGARAVYVRDAIREAEILLLAVPFNQNLVLRDALRACPGLPPVVIDTANYIPQRDGRYPDIDAGMPETAWMSTQLGVGLVKAFNNTTADSLQTRARPLGARDRIALPVCGDALAGRHVVMDLVDRLGFAPYDAGGLSDSWRQQPGQPAYASDPNVDELAALLARADRDNGPVNRDRAMALMARLPPAFPVQELVRIARLSIGLDTWKPRSWLAGLRLMAALARAAPTR
jgi:predicted dinucleotide-binding enzyme